jgi:toxin ParE1/3/4
VVARVREVVWSKSARDALDAAVAYIWEDSQQAALHLMTEALEAAASLATFSERGRVVPELDEPGVLLENGTD